MSTSVSAPKTRRLGNVLELLRPLFDVLTAIVVGLAVGALLMWWFGYDPWKAYAALLRGAFGDKWGRADTLFAAAPLVLTGLTFAIGVRAGLFNIGAQGQMLMGALAAVAVGIIPMPPVVHQTVTLGAAMLVGALWGLPAAYLKATRGVHEVISTIMLNWVARWLALYLAVRLLSDPNRAEKTVSVLASTRFSVVIPGSDLTHVVWISVLFALFIYWVLWHTPAGYGLRCTGLNQDASRYAGINPGKSVNLAFILGGMAAGLAGASQIVGRPPLYGMYTDLSTLANLGFDGIAVALLGRNHPIGAIFGALFFGALNTGTHMMQYQAQVPLEMVRVVQGVIVLAVAVPELSKIFNVWSLFKGRKTGKK